MKEKTNSRIKNREAPIISHSTLVPVLPFGYGLVGRRPLRRSRDPGADGAPLSPVSGAAMESGELLPQPEPSARYKPGRRGGWRAAFFLIGNIMDSQLLVFTSCSNQARYFVFSTTLMLSDSTAAMVFFERIGFYGVQGNLIMYLTGPLRMSTAAAAAAVNAWEGTVLVLPLVGALAADSRLGRYGAVMAASVLYLLSLGMLTASSALEASQPHAPPSTTPPARLAFFYAALYLLALAQGFHRPCAQALGADQFAPGETQAASRSSYFNWFHFFVAWGYAVAAAGISYVEDNVGRAEEGAGLVSVKLLPIWLASTVFALVISQVSTLFTKQGATMDRRVGTAGFAVPPAALLSFISVSFVILVPVYDRAVVPLARRLTGHPAGVTALQRVGSGIAASCLAMAVAAVVEARRLRVARDAGLADRPDAMVPMSLWWIVPQYLLVGLTRVLGVIGSGAMGVGSFPSGAVVSAIDWVTRGGGESWFSDNLNRAHLDYFYWLLAGLAALDVAVFFHFANRYVYTNKG
ncbi:hypothetical protein HU200_033557 [Digitaria exilis]|uniref:Uncharacterized protein n=1 Tax=Digitaria exilis TaxID=1010633 RepID=A0A835BMB0_9POAL|nr:hypothetical protein HU200_033557 [Digitaria exilis]